jgi:hypothetical protein
MPRPKKNGFSVDGVEAPIEPTDTLYPFVQLESEKYKYFWFEHQDDIIRLCSLPEDDYMDQVPFEVTDGAWFDTTDMQQALDYFRYGWPEAADTIFVEDAALSIPREIEPEFKTFNDTSGAMVDMGAYLSGVPECMLQFEQQHKHKKTVKLLINVSASGGTGSNTLKQRGKTIIAIVDWLEKSGYRVRVDVCDTVTYWARSEWVLAFCAKDFAQPLDFSRIAFMAASSAMLRRIFFAVEGSSKNYCRQFQGTYGAVCPVPKPIAAEYDYVFDYMTPVTAETAVQCIDYIVGGANTVERPDTTTAEGASELESMFSEADLQEYYNDEQNKDDIEQAMVVGSGLYQTSHAMPDTPMSTAEQVAASNMDTSSQSDSSSSNDDSPRWVWDKTHTYRYLMRRKQNGPGVGSV